MAYIRLEYPKVQVLDDDGKLAVGWKIYTYVAGTSDTDATTYSERTLSSANTNPVVLNARGEADIFTNQSIKLVLKTAADVQVWEQDYVGEVLATFYTGSSTGTTDNTYDITVSPIPSAYTDCMTVIFTPDVNNTETVDPDDFAFTGTGPNDCRFQGPYLGSTSSTFRVEIDGVSAPNTFKWRKDTEAYVTGVAITGAWQTLKEGMTVKFSVLTGHTNTDYWTQIVNPPCKYNVNALGDKLVYKNVDGAMQPIDGDDIVAGFPATIVYSAAQSCGILNNPATQTGGGDTTIGIRTRIEKTTDYELSTNDAGNLIDFANTSPAVLTLDAAANYNGMFFYIRAGGTAKVTITANGSEKIYGPDKPAGSTTYALLNGCGSTVQMQCNGVSWEILTQTPRPITQQIFWTGTNLTYTKPLDVRYVVAEVYGSGGGVSIPGLLYYGGCGGGGYASKLIDLTAVATVQYTVGAVSYGAGNTTSFGAYVSATGGGAGTLGGVGAGGVGVGGDINLYGEWGHYYIDDPVYDCHGGAGAGPLGGPRIGGVCAAGSVPITGSSYIGSGASGGTSTGAAAGGIGFIVITEFR